MRYHTCVLWHICGKFEKTLKNRAGLSQLTKQAVGSPPLFQKWIIPWRVQTDVHLFSAWSPKKHVRLSQDVPQLRHCVSPKFLVEKLGVTGDSKDDPWHRGLARAWAASDNLSSIRYHSNILWMTAALRMTSPHSWGDLWTDECIARSMENREWNKNVTCT